MLKAVCLLSLGAVWNIQAQTAQRPEPAGVTAEWDVRQQMGALAAAVKRIDPLLKHVNPKVWIEQGAPDAYIRQLQSAQASVQALVASTSQLAAEPEKLPVALEAFFQMERMELLMTSLRDGIRKYQSSELADQLSELYAANVVHRDRLRQHIRDLATLREQEYQIASEEAQRCRAVLTKQPPQQPPPSPRRAKETPPRQPSK